MLSQGYWLTKFLTISAILKKAPGQYTAAFQYTETDENDLTYFLIYQLEVIVGAIKELHGYLDRKIAEVQEAERLAKVQGLNHRQLALLGNAMWNAGTGFTIRSHATSHAVVYQTARSDLFGLVAAGLLEARPHRAGGPLLRTFRPGGTPQGNGQAPSRNLVSRTSGPWTRLAVVE